MNPKEKYITELLTPYFTGEEKFSVNENGDCVYNGPDGAMCVFAKANLSNHGTGILTDEAKSQGISPSTWYSVQQIHDRAACGDLLTTLNLAIGLLKHIGEFKELRDVVASWHEQNNPATFFRTQGQSYPPDSLRLG